jgi:hypothetical protein
MLNLETRYGRWTVVDPTDARDGKTLCRCDCGTERRVRRHDLKAGLTTSCGCSRKPEAPLPVRRYGRWTIVEPLTEKPRAQDRVLCRCDCGNERRIRFYKLVEGHTKSCGCLRRDRMTGVAWPQLAPENDGQVVPGARFGRWTVIGEPESGKNRVALCECDCGTQRKVVIGHLLNGKTKSCGCLRRDACGARHQVA